MFFLIVHLYFQAFLWFSFVIIGSLKLYECKTLTNLNKTIIKIKRGMKLK